MLCTFCQSNRSRWMPIFMCYMWVLACIIGKDHDVLAPEVGSAWSAKDAHLPVVRSAVRDSTEFMDVALIRVCNPFSRICCWLLRLCIGCYEHQPLYSALSCPQIIQLSQYPHCSECEKFEMVCSLCSLWEKSWAKVISRPWAMLLWEKGDMGKVNLFLLSSLILLFFHFLHFWGAELFSYTPRLP